MDTLVQGAVFLAIAGLWSVFVAKVLGPWAWARAVDNPKSKASKVLTRVLKETREAIAEDVKAVMPTLPVVPTVAEVKGAVDEGLKGLTISMPTEQFESVLDAWWAKKSTETKMAAMRAAKGERAGEIEPEEAQRLARIAESPEQAAKKDAAMKALEYIGENGWLKPKTIKALEGQIDAAFREGRDLDAILEPYRNLLGGVAGGSASRGKGSGGLTPLG